MMNEKTKKNKIGITGVWLPGEVAFNKNLNMTDMFIWWIINSLDSTKNHCWASNNYIAEIIGVKPLAVSTSIAKLKKQGYIEQVGFDGRKRKLAICSDYIKKHKKHKEEFYETINRDEDEDKKQPNGKPKGRLMKNHKADLCKTINNINKPINSNYKNRIINNSIVSKETNKKRLTRTIKSKPISKPKNRPQPIYKEQKNLSVYSKDVQDVFQHWQDQNITVHRKSKARDEALELLNKTLHHYSKSELIKSIDAYKKLLDDPYSKLEDRPPFKVGLNRFLKFDNYLNTKNTPGLKDIKSWFEECLKDDLSHLMKQGKDKHPELTKEIKRQYLDKIDNIEITSIDENSFRKTSTLLTEFWNTHLDRFNLHPSENRNVIQFLPIFIEYMKGVSNNGDRYPGLMCYSLSEKSGNKFYNWLKKMNYFKSKSSPFEIKIDHSQRANLFDCEPEY